MRFILHDWPNAENLKILKHIRAAASPSSKLILFEFCIQHACPDAEHSRYSAEIKSAPYPLLANFGMGSGAYDTFVDMQVCLEILYHVFGI